MEKKLSELVDLLIVGPYIVKLHEPTGLRGSSNQEYLFCSDRYNEQDILSVPCSEIIFNNGESNITGIDSEQVSSWFS